MSRIERTAVSREDLLAILAFYRAASPQAARRIHRAINETLHFLAENPAAGPKREELARDLRSFPVSHYRHYLILYRPIADGIQVIRVLHGARDLPPLLRGQ